MKILFLDDDDTRHEVIRPYLARHDATQVHDADQAMVTLAAAAAMAAPFEVILLDYDLPSQTARAEQTGLVVAQFVAKQACKPALTFIHSNNPYGAAQMAKALEGCGRVIVAPFGVSLVAQLAIEGIAPTY